MPLVNAGMASSDIQKMILALLMITTKASLTQSMQESVNDNSFSGHVKFTFGFLYHRTNIFQ